MLIFLNDIDLLIVIPPESFSNCRYFSHQFSTGFFH